MDEWETIEEKARCAKVTLDDLDSGIEGISDKYGIFGLEIETMPSAGYVYRMKQKRLKSTKER